MQAEHSAEPVWKRRNQVNRRTCPQSAKVGHRQGQDCMGSGFPARGPGHTGISGCGGSSPEWQHHGRDPIAQHQYGTRQHSSEFGEQKCQPDGMGAKQ